MNKLYQYYSIMEINLGKVIIHKNVIPFPYKKLKEYQYKTKLKISYSKAILDSSLFEKIGLINFDYSGYFYTSRFSYPVKFPPIHLILALYNEEIIANELPIPDRNGNLIENSECLKRNEHYVSVLAIEHYLENNNPKYLKDSEKLQFVINEINKSYLNNIKFIKLELNSPNFNSSYLSNEVWNPEMVKHVNDCIVNNNEIQKFYFNSVAGFRQYDLYENQKFWEYEGGNGYYDFSNNSSGWEKPTNSEINLKWMIKSNEWDKNFIDSLISISEKHKKEFFLKGSFDFPVVDDLYNYHLL